MRSFALFVIITFAFHSLLAQQTTLKGVVVDKKTKEPLPYIHVFHTIASTGTVTDLNGEFSLVIRSTNDSLRFSSIGYNTQRLPIKSFLNKTLIIELEEDRILLPGMVIHELSAKEFIRKSVSKVTDNYDQFSINTKAFYWNSVRHEDLFTDFYEGYVHLSTSGVHYDSTLLSIRDSSRHIELFDSLDDILNFDVVNQASMFVNPVNIDDWKYEYQYSAEYANEKFVIIEAQMIQNPFKEKTSFSTLKIFIEASRYAIVRVDFSYHWQHGKRYSWKDDQCFTVSRLDGTVEYTRNPKQKYSLSYLFIGTEFSFAKWLNPRILSKAFINHELVIPENPQQQKPVVRWSDYLDATHGLNTEKPNSGQD